jgi:hypothetical protein
MNEETREAFERIAKNRDMRTIVAYYEEMLRGVCDIRVVKAEDFEKTRLAADFIQKEMIDKFKKYDVKTVSHDNNHYL